MHPGTADCEEPIGARQRGHRDHNASTRRNPSSILGKTADALEREVLVNREQLGQLITQSRRKPLVCFGRRTFPEPLLILELEDIAATITVLMRLALNGSA